MPTKRDQNAIKFIEGLAERLCQQNIRVKCESFSYFCDQLRDVIAVLPQGELKATLCNNIETHAQNLFELVKNGQKKEDVKVNLFTSSGYSEAMSNPVKEVVFEPHVNVETFVMCCAEEQKLDLTLSKDPSHLAQIIDFYLHCSNSDTCGILSPFTNGQVLDSNVYFYSLKLYECYSELLQQQVQHPNSVPLDLLYTCSKQLEQFLDFTMYRRSMTLPGKYTSSYYEPSHSVVLSDSEHLRVQLFACLVVTRIFFPYCPVVQKKDESSLSSSSEVDTDDEEMDNVVEKDPLDVAGHFLSKMILCFHSNEFALMDVFNEVMRLYPPSVALVQTNKEHTMKMLFQFCIRLLKTYKVSAGISVIAYMKYVLCLRNAITFKKALVVNPFIRKISSIPTPTPLVNWLELSSSSEKTKGAFGLSHEALRELIRNKRNMISSLLKVNLINHESFNVFVHEIELAFVGHPDENCCSTETKEEENEETQSQALFFIDETGIKKDENEESVDKKGKRKRKDQVMPLQDKLVKQ